MRFMLHVLKGKEPGAHKHQNRHHGKDHSHIVNLKQNGKRLCQVKQQKHFAPSKSQGQYGEKRRDHKQASRYREQVFSAFHFPSDKQEDPGQDGKHNWQ